MRTKATLVNSFITTSCWSGLQFFSKNNNCGILEPSTSSAVAIHSQQAMQFQFWDFGHPIPAQWERFLDNRDPNHWPHVFGLFQQQQQWWNNMLQFEELCFIGRKKNHSVSGSNEGGGSGSWAMSPKTETTEIVVEVSALQLPPWKVPKRTFPWWSTKQNISHLINIWNMECGMSKGMNVE